MRLSNFCRGYWKTSDTLARINGGEPNTVFINDRLRLTRSNSFITAIILPVDPLETFAMVAVDFALLSCPHLLELFFSGILARYTNGKQQKTLYPRSIRCLWQYLCFHNTRYTVISAILSSTCGVYVRDRYLLQIAGAFDSPYSQRAHKNPKYPLLFYPFVYPYRLKDIPYFIYLFTDLLPYTVFSIYFSNYFAPLDATSRNAFFHSKLNIFKIFILNNNKNLFIVVFLFT